MYNFTNDYNETVHPELLKAVTSTTNQKIKGYGLDDYCTKSKESIKQQLQSPNADIHFMPGGTITNLTVISHILKPYQAIIAANSGHVNVHETGAIEATGHKVLTVKTEDGKLTPELIEEMLIFHCDEHMVQPKLVYISNTTELGTIYTKQELREIYQFCQKKHLYLYLDGARLAMALAATENDISFPDLAKYTDIFYIGGTKVGTFLGEVVVFNNTTISKDFRFSMKQKGAILAKSWIVAVQMNALMQNNLYLELGRHSNNMAEKLKTIFENAGLTFAFKPQSNQLFVNFPNNLVKKILSNYSVDNLGAMGIGYTCLRFCTSWATQEDEIQTLAKYLKGVIDI
ncbi:threonine aldolase family protein [Gilliamella sp. wkB112]|uniref:threonine aldolase family protein n=1 Tax=Gilliamella sp. wkB112 TaxID=3120257 RepID=UPI00080DB4D3|nr:aminotransferase class I/II-fold pyridoxal phosphate-dependent enzyme [Gilliamella apicola]OCG00192.1 threonine aldolase [Gilliamella apicola]